MRWAGEHDPPDEPPETVPEVGGDWEATPWLRCTTCGYAESEGITLTAMFNPDEVPPEGGSPDVRLIAGLARSLEGL
jgi:hypothetical protein